MICLGVLAPDGHFVAHPIRSNSSCTGAVRQHWKGFLPVDGSLAVICPVFFCRLDAGDCK